MRQRGLDVLGVIAILVASSQVPQGLSLLISQIALAGLDLSLPATHNE
jgi:hypothetical protein